MLFLNICVTHQVIPGLECQMCSLVLVGIYYLQFTIYYLLFTIYYLRFTTSALLWTQQTRMVIFCTQPDPPKIY